MLISPSLRYFDAIRRFLADDIADITPHYAIDAISLFAFQLRHADAAMPLLLLITPPLPLMIWFRHFIFAAACRRHTRLR
jgi:hypothetical protein